MQKISKNKKETLSKLDLKQFFELKKAIQLAKEASYAKFDESVEVIFNLNLNTRKADQQLRGSVSLPGGTGKSIKILATSDDSSILEAAKKAGANLTADAQKLEIILKKGDFDFDVIIATPRMMVILGKFGKVLGPKGLMPNPKTGTVTLNLAKAVTDIKAGKANYRTDKDGNIHTMIGKKSFHNSILEENAQIVIDLIKKLKPKTIKGVYIKNIVIKTTMGAAVKVKLSQ